ncbi:universal stress protein [Thermogemmatispora carboxidivorans]|uniref:universal stress protein n=1 Tax=Thermogemmatispora carboxidivorans TaxID=1382306 RepID=UPI0006999892|nr:universal stress protein [Thermogemmatispora carboxidivorans]
MSRRWLLPFSWEVDVEAIDAIVRLAALEGASLIALSLLPGATTRSPQQLRAEYWQQSLDFLEVVRWKRQRYGVQGEAYELLSEDLGESIVSFAHEFACDRVLVIRRPHGDALLPAPQVQRLLREGLVPLMLLYWPEQPAGLSLVQRLRSWLKAHRPGALVRLGSAR